MPFRLGNNWKARKLVSCRTGCNLPVVSRSWNPERTNLVKNYYRVARLTLIGDYVVYGRMVKLSRIYTCDAGGKLGS